MYLGAHLVGGERLARQKKLLHCSLTKRQDRWKIYCSPQEEVWSEDPWAGPSNTETFRPVWDCMASLLWFPEGVQDHMSTYMVLEVWSPSVRCEMLRGNNE